MLRGFRREGRGVARQLRCHPATPANKVTGVAVDLLANGPSVTLVFTVAGADGLIVPAPEAPERGDQLWRTTCFEMFWRAEDGEGYVELNFSASKRWAAYAFDGYRSGMRDHPMTAAPVISPRRDGDRLVVEVRVDRSAFPSGLAQIGLAAVIAERDGTISYWALAHPPGKPDFHHPACFALELPAPDAA